MTEKLNQFGLLVGRILLALIFVMSGSMKVMNWSQTADSMAAENMPAVPFFLVMAILVEIGGGLSVLLGYKCSWGALLLAAFLIPVTLTFHHFWTYEGAAIQNQMQHFMKNVTIMGGLIALAAVGAGQYSLDALSHRATWTHERIPDEHDHVMTT